MSQPDTSLQDFQSYLARSRSRALETFLRHFLWKRLCRKFTTMADALLFFHSNLDDIRIPPFFSSFSVSLCFFLTGFISRAFSLGSWNARNATRSSTLGGEQSENRSPSPPVIFASHDGSNRTRRKVSRARSKFLTATTTGIFRWFHRDSDEKRLWRNTRRIERRKTRKKSGDTFSCKYFGGCYMNFLCTGNNKSTMILYMYTDGHKY